MPLKRVIMILGASLEFEKKFNSEIIERETDEFEMPKVSLIFTSLVRFTFASFGCFENGNLIFLADSATA